MYAHSSTYTISGYITAFVPSLARFQVGNPVLDDYKNDKGSLEFLWNHGVMSDEIWANITAHCSFGPSDGVSCEEAKSAFDFRPNFVKNAGNINPYNIYAPVCIQAPNGTAYPSGYVREYIISTSLIRSTTLLYITRELISS
jgi:serine carboxypeptidase-like clade II